MVDVPSPPRCIHLHTPDTGAPVMAGITSHSVGLQLRPSSNDVSRIIRHRFVYDVCSPSVAGAFRMIDSSLLNKLLAVMESMMESMMEREGSRRVCKMEHMKERRRFKRDEVASILQHS